jgi:phosphatidylglycerol lysyltransferase
MQPDPAPRVTLKQSLGHQSLGRRLLHHLPALLGLGLLGGACFVVWRQFRHLKFEQVAAAVRDLPTHAVLMAAVWTFFAYFVLTFYDQLGTIYAGHKVSYRRASFASFCAYTLSHNLGLAAVSGAAVRYRLYSHWGLSPVQIAKVVAFCSLTFGLGAMVLAGIVLWVEPDTVPFFGPLAPRWVMHLAGLLFWGVVGGYVTLAKLFPVFTFRGTHVELPQLRMAMVQVALATLDVAMTATIFYALLPPAPGLTWLRFLGVYLASYSAGLVASLPGGLLVFDSAMLLGLAKWVHEPQVLSAIVIYRLFYYIIPLFMAGGLFAGNELMLRGGSIWRRLRGAPGRPGGPRAPSWSEPDFAVATATGAVALCGFLLLALSVVSPRPDFSWIDPELADVAAEAGQ